MEFPFDVSRETMERLKAFEALLLKWQKTHNLVSRETIDDVWGRHILDSAQVFQIYDSWQDKDVADLGSGAGFPGMVLAILGVTNMTLIESNHKKCSFLREVKRQLGLTVQIHEGRIEDLSDRTFDMITSRALASLDKLLHLSCPLLHKASECLFLKGKMQDEEIKEAEENWSFHLRKKESITSPGAAILILTQVRPRNHEDHFRCESKGGCGEDHHRR